MSDNEPQTTDTFTDARGQRFIAGCPVPERVWERFHEVADARTPDRTEGEP